MVNSNLSADYLRFIKAGGKIDELTQDVIDRIQYNEDFLEHLCNLLEHFESPFEIVVENDVHTRKLKQSFYKNNSVENEQTNIQDTEHVSGDNTDSTV